MLAKKLWWAPLVVLAFGLIYPSILRALQTNNSSPTVPVSMIVTVEAKHGKELPTIYKEDVRVFHDHDRLPVQEWVPYRGDQAGLELFLLIDDSNSSELGLQLDDLRKFINAQPETTAVAVGYIRDGSLAFVQTFTKDHALAARALRLPLGFGGAMASPYMAVSDAIQRWPQSTNRRVMFLVSSGIDPLQPGPVNSYLDEAITRAQRAGIQVYSIYASRSGHFGHTFWRYSWGQNNLSRLADETGAEAYMQAMEMPISYESYLKELSERLTHQYRLTFLAKTRKDGGFQKIRLETEVPNAELVAAENVYVPEAK